MEWQLCNEDENGSLLRREKKPFSLNWCPGPFLVSAVHVGLSWRIQQEAWGGLSGPPDQHLCFVSVSNILFREESTCVCAELLAWNRTASISCAEAVGKSSSPTLTTHAGLVICSVVVYLLDTKSHALLFLLSS